MPSMPPAPGLSSTTTAWFQRTRSRSPRMRAITSSELAGEAGTMIRTVWLGHCCACAPGVSNAMMASARNRFTEGPFVGGGMVAEK
jgi:hypothetical protein